MFFQFLIGYQREFNKIRWSVPCNSDQNCTQNYPQGWSGCSQGLVEGGVFEGREVLQWRGVREGVGLEAVKV